MLTSTLKQLASRLSLRSQQELKRLHFGRLIRNGTFMTAEEHDTEYGRLDAWVRRGDWVIDVGANVGNYSARLSQLVGPEGHVFAFEPISETFELLTANMMRQPLRNITLFNAAVSDGIGLSGMEVPRQADGLENRYMAKLTETADAPFRVLRLSVDALELPHRVSLVKIDVEGHELSAVRGMRSLLARDHPVLVVEGRDAEVASFLQALGYAFTEQSGSPNRVFSSAR